MSERASHYITWRASKVMKSNWLNKKPLKKQEIKRGRRSSHPSPQQKVNNLQNTKQQESL